MPSARPETGTRLLERGRRGTHADHRLGGAAPATARLLAPLRLGTAQGAPPGPPQHADRPPVSLHVRVIAALHARTPAGSRVTSKVAASIESTRHPRAKLDLISCWRMRRGPQSPGWRSLKHSM